MLDFETYRVLKALKQEQRIVHVSFNHSGASGPPGRLRVYKRVLADVWKAAGTVEEVVYHPQLLSCIITYGTFVQAKLAVRLFNSRTAVEQLKQSSLAFYVDPADISIAESVYDLLFVEHLGSVLRASMYPSKRLHNF